MLSRLVRGCIVLAFTACVLAVACSRRLADAVKGGQLSYVASMFEIGVGWRSVTSMTRPSVSEMAAIFNDESTYFFCKDDRLQVLRLYAQLQQRLAEYDEYMHSGLRHVAECILTRAGWPYVLVRFGVAVVWPVVVLSAGAVVTVLQEITGVFMLAPLGALALLPIATLYTLAPSVHAMLRAWLVGGSPRRHSLHVSIIAPPVRPASATVSVQPAALRSI